MSSYGPRSLFDRSVFPILVAIMPRNKKHDLSFGLFRSFSGRAWPRDPLQRVRLEKCNRTHPKLAPESNYKAMSWQYPGLGQQTKNDGMIAGKFIVRSMAESVFLWQRSTVVSREETKSWSPAGLPGTRPSPLPHWELTVRLAADAATMH